MDDEMIERCIDALELSYKKLIEKYSGQTFEETKVNLPKRDNWREYAVTVIKAMREPTAAMIIAGSGFESQVDTWQAMIDAVIDD